MEEKGVFMKWFVGLGNPGGEYASTRHNVGFMALDYFAEQTGISFKLSSKCRGLIGEGNVKGAKVILLKPQTYMNLSGESMRAFMDFYKVELKDMVVVYDDLDTFFGQVRLRYQGSAGGHNGIKSIIQHAGTQTFNRIRMGVSRPKPGYDIADYVLSSFTKDEAKQLKPFVELCSEVMHYSLENPFEKTMAKFNV
jgi:peptidyl-tRNA hydrolase, PTH1 family